MDRPSITFEAGHGQFGTVGAQSPLCQYEASIRDEGVPFYVHEAPRSPVQGEWYDRIETAINDSHFLKRFQSGPGNYGEMGGHDDDQLCRFF